MTARAPRLLLFVFLTSFLAAGVLPAAAQSTLGRVVGIVRDASGAVMPGASVLLESRATGAQLETTSQADGAFIFPQVRPGLYTVKVELSGFKPVTYNDVKVDPGQEYSLNAALEVGGLSEAVQVTAGVDLVHTTTPEVTNTVRQEQILELPLNARNPIELIRLQAGVPGMAARNSTAINGGRPTWTQTTQDGINIQDNFIRTNSLDFVPNRPTSDIVGEFTIVTNTQGVDAAGGASQVRMITPSGTNELHGSVYEFNRHSRLSANSWFNNRDNLPKPYLNRNQWGGRAGGPVLKGKLFYFGYYEKFSQKNEATPNNQIPLNDDYLQGVFRYRSPGSTEVRSVNLLQLSGLRLDPAVQSRLSSLIGPASNVNNADVGDGLNRGGYRFNQEDVTTRHYVGGRFDYNASAAHQFEGTFTRLSDVDDRTDLDTIHEKPLVYTSSVTKFFVGAWRWTATSRLQNEVRAGGNLAPVAFESTEDFGDAIFNMPNGLTNPIATFQPQGRDTRTYQFIDTATYVTGDHTLQFGGSFQRVKVNPYNFANRFPTITFGFSAAAPTSVQLLGGAVPRRHQRQRPDRGHRAPGLHRGHRVVGGADVPGPGPVVGLRRRHSRRPQLHPGQQQRLHPGQLAREARPDHPRRPQVGVLQPAARGQQPAAAADAGGRSVDARRAARPGRHRRLRQRRDVQGRQEQLRADHRLRLGSVQERADVGARRLHPRLRQRGHRHGRPQRRDRQLRAVHRRRR